MYTLINEENKIITDENNTLLIFNLKKEAMKYKKKFKLNSSNIKEAYAGINTIAEIKNKNRKNLGWNG